MEDIVFDENNLYEELDYFSELNEEILKYLTDMRSFEMGVMF